MNRTARRLAAATLLTAIGGSALSIATGGPAAALGCSYKVTGNIVSNNNQLELSSTTEIDGTGVDALESNAPVAGAQIRLQASIGSAVPYLTQVESTTGPDGEFSMMFEELLFCDKERFKIDVKLSSDELVVGGGGWLTVVEESNATHAPGTTAFGNVGFSESGTGDGDDTDDRLAAETWIAVRRAMDYLDGEGVGFSQKITINTSYNNVLVPDDREASYSDPIFGNTSNIFVDDSKNLGTILHEIGHLWAYGRTTGEDCLLGEFLNNLEFDVHDPVEPACVAFHEGFASYFSDRLGWELVQAGELRDGDGVVTIDLPYPSAFNRFTLNNATSDSDLGRFSSAANLTSTSVAQTNEWGWTQALRVLGQKLIRFQSFGTASSSPGGQFVVSSIGAASGSSPSISAVGSGPIVSAPCTKTAPAGLQLDDVLTVVSGMSTSSPTFSSFYSRADSRLSGFSSTDATNFRDFANPASTVEPSARYCA